MCCCYDLHCRSPAEPVLAPRTTPAGHCATAEQQGAAAHICRSCQCARQRGAQELGRKSGAVGESAGCWGSVSLYLRYDTSIRTVIPCTRVPYRQYHSHNLPVFCLEVTFANSNDYLKWGVWVGIFLVKHAELQKPKTSYRQAPGG